MNSRRWRAMGIAANRKSAKLSEEKQELQDRVSALQNAVDKRSCRREGDAVGMTIRHPRDEAV